MRNFSSLKLIPALTALLSFAPELAHPLFSAGRPQDPPQDPASLEGVPVVAVRIIDRSGRILEENPPSAGVTPGMKFDSLHLREALRQLYGTGRFAEIQVEATRLADGVRIDFLVRENLFFNVVRIEGLRNDRLTSRTLASLQLNLGEVYAEDKVEEARQRLLETLSEEGFYEAKVDVASNPQPATRQMDITFRVTTGPRARLGAISVTNRTQFADKEVLGKSNLEPEQTLTPRRLDRATERVRQFLTKKGYLGARIFIRRGTYLEKSRSVPIQMEVVAGPRVRLQVEGASVPNKTLRQAIPIYQEGTVDEDLLQEGRRNLRAYFEREGYFDAIVEFTETEDAQAGQRIITYSVDRGPRRRLVGVDFAGNNYFSKTLLREQLRIQPAAFLDRGIFSRRLLSADEGRIKALYVANGFQGAAVKSEIVEKFGGDEESLFVRFTITEGQQTRVASLTLEGVQSLEAQRLLDTAASTEGQPYSEFNVAADRDNILTIYFSEGFPEARFDYRVAPAEAPNRVNLFYHIHEGPQTRVAQVLIGGNEFTKPHVIRREVEVTPAEPLRLGEVVESQRRLYNLGVFNRVQIAPQNPGGTEQDKTVVVLVDEARRYTMAYGGGIEFQRLGSGGDPTSGAVRASPRGLFEISKANFAGRAHTVSFKARASTLQGRALISYAAPNFLGRPKFSFLLTALADKTSDVRTFTSQRYEGGLQIDHRSSRATSFLYRYFFRKVLVDASSLQIDPQQIPLFSQPTLISGFGATWIRDRRDSPAEAQKGDFNSADVSVSEKRIGSSASFVRFLIQNSTFHRVARNLTFARSARFGVQEPFSETASQEIPLPERFFAGGGNSLRGFGLNQAGPRDPSTGFPLGGLALLVLNNELRFPMKLPKLGNKVGGAIFYDGGNVYTRVSDVTFRTSPASPTDLDYFSHTIGFGFRYATPIGPVRLDLGYLLNPPEFNVDDGMGGTRLTRLPRFQFFLNIGSIF